MTNRSASGRRLIDAVQHTVRSVGVALPPRLRQLPQYWYWTSFLRGAEYWPRERIDRWQLGRLRALVRYASEHTEGYRQLYRNAGVSWRDIRTCHDINLLPFTTKAMLQKEVESFSPKRLFRRYVTTGGSTGIPFGFYTAPAEGAVENAFMHAGWQRFGYVPGTATAVLRGAFIGSAQNWWVFDEFRRELKLSTYQLTPDALADYCAKLAEYRIDVIQAYPSAFNMLCEFILEKNLRPPVLRLVLLGSENIYDWQMAKFTKVFPRTRFGAWFGHAERAILAPWCELTRQYHAWPFYGITEVLGPDGREVEAGLQGELVGTGFHNTATPLIRYRTMDVAVKGAPRCAACGRNFQLLQTVVGRLHEFIVTGRSRFISMTAINFHDDIFDDISQFQFYQDKAGAVSLRYVPKSSFGPASVDRIRRGLLEKLGDDVELTLERVTEIPRTISGKLRFLDQRLPMKYGDA